MFKRCMKVPFASGSGHGLSDLHKANFLFIRAASQSFRTLSGKCSIKRSSKGKGIKPVALARTLGVWREGVRVGRGNPFDSGSGHCISGNASFFTPADSESVYQKEAQKVERRGERTQDP
jgi:hypothetical protein